MIMFDLLLTFFLNYWDCWMSNCSIKRVGIMIMTSIYGTMYWQQLLAFFIQSVQEKMERTVPIGQVKFNQKGRVCVSPLGIDSIFAVSCPNAGNSYSYSPYFLLGNYRCNLHGLVLSVWGIHSSKKCILNIVIKPPFAVVTC